MKLNIEEVNKNLKTSILGKEIIYYEEIDSTQDEVKRIINDIKDGTYIVTDKQIKGKGTHGRIWYDNGYENICGSFILMPNCNISKLENLTMTIAESLVETIKKLYNINLQIKYPNDIMCNSKKMAGILTESVSSNEIVKYIIVGIGINVNQIKFADEIGDIATSLKNEYPNTYSRELIISEFFNNFEDRYFDLIK